MSANSAASTRASGEFPTRLQIHKLISRLTPPPSPPKVPLTLENGDINPLASPSASPPPRPLPFTLTFLLSRLSHRFARGFALAFSLKSLLNFIGLMVRHRARMNRVLPQWLAGLGKDPTQYGLFLGTALASFEGVMRVTKHMQLFEEKPQQSTAETALVSAPSSPDSIASSKRILLSGLVCGLVSFPFVPKTARVTVALFFALRATEAWVRVLGGHYEHRLPRVAKHLDVAVFSLATAHVLWAGIFRRDTIDPGYLAFVQHHCGKPRSLLHVWGALHGNAHGLDAFPRAKMEFAEVLRTRWAEPCRMIDYSSATLACDVMHPHTAYCGEAAVVFFRESFERSARLYVPMYGLSLVLFRMKALLRKPATTLVSVARHILRSTLFLSSYCTLSWAVMCILSNAGWQSRGWHTAVAGVAAGFCFLVEQRSRRIELALYVSAHALQSFYLVWGPSGSRVLPRIPYFVPGLYSLALAGYLRALWLHPSAVRSQYYQTARFLWGGDEPGGGAGAGSEIGFPQLVRGDEKPQQAKGKKASNQEEKALAPPLAAI